MRKNGCPTNVRNWQVDVLSRASSRTNPSWIRIKGVNSISQGISGDTEDGSGSDSLWGEPYVTKRNGTLNIEARPVVDAVTGEQDPGQAELDYYATQGGCDGDCTLRIADPYGRCQIVDVVITDSNKDANDTEESRTWNTSIVGEPEDVPYVQVSSLTVKVGEGTPSDSPSASLTVGGTQACTVAFVPTGASNQKYSVASADTTKVRVKNIDGLSFDLEGVAATTSAVNVIVKSMNNAKTATIAVTVTAS